MNYAFQLHRRQVRNGSNVPYFAHLIGVSSLVMEYGGDEELAIAGLLHDAAEDQGGTKTLAEIERRFGATVAAVVHACSDSLDKPKPPWRERKERYIEHLAAASPGAQLVSACDKLYNARAIVADLRTVGDALWDRFSGGRAGVLWYYETLARTFTLDSPVVAEFRRTVGELHDAARPGRPPVSE